MSDPLPADGLESPAFMLRAITDRARVHAAEHERKMREDLGYRAEHEQRQAEAREREAEEKRDEEAQRQAALAGARRRKRIPEAFWPLLDARRAGKVRNPPISVAKANAIVERFLAGAPGWVFLLLLGPVGTGKTVAACAFLDAPRTEPDPFGGAPRRREAGGMFVTAEELAKASAFDADYWNGIRDAPRLVIDDLGVELLDGKGWAAANLGALFSHRHAHELPTVVTANLTRKALEDRYMAADGGRLRDRFAQSAWSVELAGPSLRKPLTLPPVED
jgi:DNA replication protein DnaC